MRDYPDPDRQIRENFEALRDDLRMKKINIAVNAATGAYAGAQVGGPVGAAIGVAAGSLIGYWQYKAYRKQVYAMYEAAGLVRKPRRRIRSIFYQDPSDPAFVRYPHAELVGDVVLDILKTTKPEMTEAQINKEAYAIVRAFDIFRRENPDIPVELAADVILMLNGIMRNPQSGMYERFAMEEKPEPLPDMLPDVLPDERQPVSEVAIAWGLAGLAFVIYLTRRKK